MTTLRTFPPLILCLLLGYLFSLGCGGDAPTTGDGPLTVVATTGMLADATRNLVGDHARVVQLLKSDVDPHTYKPTADDVKQLMRAGLIVYNGLHLEGKMGEAIAAASKQAGTSAIAVAEQLPESKQLHEEGGEHDPHVWMDVALWSTCVEALAGKLIERLPAHAEAIQANRDRYLGELAKLDAYVRARLATIPEQRRVLVTAHDAFNYFGAAYGIEVEGVQGLSTESEAGMTRISALVGLLKTRKINAVFAESSVASDNVKALIEGAAAAGHEVKLGGELFSDAMGPAGTYEGTYIGMMDSNATVVTRALGGEAPQKGMAGKLSQR